MIVKLVNHDYYKWVKWVCSVLEEYSLLLGVGTHDYNGEFGEGMFTMFRLMNLNGPASLNGASNRINRNTRE